MRFLLMMFMSATLFVSGCSEPYHVPTDFHFKPHNKTEGLMVMTIACHGFDPGTTNYLYYENTETNQFSRVFGAGTTSFVTFNCNSPWPQNSINKLPAGNYIFTDLSFGKRVNSLMKVKFNVKANYITYIGRLDITKEKSINTNDIMGTMLPPGTVRYSISNKDKEDLPYFLRTYRGVNPYHIRVAIGT